MLKAKVVEDNYIRRKVARQAPNPETAKYEIIIGDTQKSIGKCRNRWENKNKYILVLCVRY